MKTGPRYKICRRFGTGVFEKCQTQKYEIAEAKKSRSETKRRGRMLSDFGRQMKEKQRLRLTYGISERQFCEYVRKATETKGGDSSGQLLAFLESRLDNIVYRIGLAPTRRSARQLVSHGHIMVAGKRVTIPSYHMRQGIKFEIREGSRIKTFWTNLLSDTNTNLSVPEWLSFDMANAEGSVTGMPTLKNTEAPADLGVVLEFYSR
jgi:small subunit ribosomal protein S4